MLYCQLFLFGERFYSHELNPLDALLLAFSVPHLFPTHYEL